MTQGTDEQSCFGPTNESVDFWSSAQQLLFQNQSKINAASNEYSDWLGGNNQSWPFLV